MKIIHALLFSFLFIFLTMIAYGDRHYIGKYADCDGSTDKGESVTGECYFYTNQYGDFDGETDSGVPASGECYRYSGSFAELEGVNTDNGESVTGECYIYGL